MQISRKLVDELTYEIIGAAIDVHREMGPGLKEAVYEDCMTIAFQERNLAFECQYCFRPTFRGRPLKSNSRIDLLVEKLIVVELKSVAALTDIDRAQVMNYINLLELPKAILLNFNVINLARDGKETFVNHYYQALPPD